MAEVMVAHDSAYLRSLLGAVVGTEHTVVDEVTNGVEAVESCPTADPDAVVLAASMPIQDGIDAAETIRERDPSVGLVLCLDADGNRRAEAAASPADTVLATPFRTPGVLEAIAVATDG